MRRRLLFFLFFLACIMFKINNARSHVQQVSMMAYEADSSNKHKAKSKETGIEYVGTGG